MITHPHSPDVVRGKVAVKSLELFTDFLAIRIPIFGVKWFVLSAGARRMGIRAGRNVRAAIG